MKPEKVIYIAGPMRNYVHWNFEAFFAAGAWLRSKGWEVKCPAEQDVKDGVDAIKLNISGNDESLSPHEQKQFILRDMQFVADSDAIFLLHGWALSKGATLELRMAEFLGKEVIHERDGDFRKWESKEMVLRNRADIARTAR